MLFATPRLVVRPFGRDDASAIIPFWGDADTVRFIGDGEPWVSDHVSAEACIERTRAYYQRHPGYGIFAVELKAGARLAGHVLLKPLEPGEVEVGWLLDRRYRGLGIATEAADGMLGYGFSRLRLPAIVAVMDPENSASRRVAEGLGMAYRGTRPERGTTVAWYRMGREAYLGTGRRQKAMS